MSTVVLLIITAFGLGALYFLVASGLSLIYGLMGILNFAHGSFLTLGAFLGWEVAQQFGAHSWASLGISLVVGAVVGEFISSQRGLGHLIFTASSLYDLNTVWVGLFTLMAVGFVLYYVIDWVERRLLPWKVIDHRQDLRV